MSFFDFLTGSKSKTSQSSTTTQNSDVEKQSIEVSDRLSAQQKAAQQAGQSTQFSFDADVLNVINDLIKNTAAGGNANAGIAKDLAASLAQRASTADQDLQGLIAPIINRSRIEGERGINQQVTQLASASGGGSDTTLELIKGELHNDLNSNLASREAELALNLRQLATQEGATALAGLTSGEETGSVQIANIAALLDSVKGGKITSDTLVEEQSTTDEAVSLTQALEELVKGKTVSTSTGTGTNSNSGSVLDILGVLSKFK